MGNLDPRSLKFLGHPPCRESRNGEGRLARSLEEAAPVAVRSVTGWQQTSMGKLNYWMVQDRHFHFEPHNRRQEASPCVVRSTMSTIIRPSRRMRWAGHVARIGEGKTCTRFRWESPRERDHLKDQDVREVGMKMDLREIGWGGVEWIHLAQERDGWRALVNAVMNPWVLAPRS
jgi:hypothetical protein